MGSVLDETPMYTGGACQCMRQGPRGAKEGTVAARMGGAGGHGKHSTQTGAQERNGCRDQ